MYPNFGNPATRSDEQIVVGKDKRGQRVEVKLRKTTVYIEEPRCPWFPVRNLYGHFMGTGRFLKVDDVLWVLAFALTMWYFELPISLFTDNRVEWFYLRCALMCHFCFFVIGFYLSATINELCPAAQLPRVFPQWFLLATAMFIMSCIFFCCATWNMWNIWSIYILYVTFMFFIVVASFL